MSKGGTGPLDPSRATDIERGPEAPTSGGQSEGSDSWGERWARHVADLRDRLRHRRGGAAAAKAVVGVVGTLVLFAGIAMLALPGPGWATIVAGLAILSIEFRWAAKLRHGLVRTIVSAGRWVQRQPWWLRLLSWTAVALAILLAGYLSLAAVGVPSWLPDQFEQMLRRLPLMRG